MVVLRVQIDLLRLSRDEKIRELPSTTLHRTPRTRNDATTVSDTPTPQPHRRHVSSRFAHHDALHGCERQQPEQPPARFY